MKNLQRIIACVLALSMIFALASCQKEDDKYEKDSSTSTTESTTEFTTEEEGTTDESASEEESSTDESTSTTTSTTTTTQPTTKKKETTTKKKETTTKKKETTTKSQDSALTYLNLVGTWVSKESIDPIDWYDEEIYYPNITKSDIVIETYYVFDQFYNFKTYSRIANIETFRAEYRAANLYDYEKYLGEGEKASPEMVEDIYYRTDLEIENIVQTVESSTSGKFTASSNTITYTISGISFAEYYTLSGEKLTITGASLEGYEAFYPVTFTKVS